MDNTENKSLLGSILKHWLAFTSTIGFLVTAIGVWAMSVFYEKYGINYVEYADVSDFVRHTISQRFIVFLVILLIITIVFMIVVVEKLDENYSRLKKLKTIKNLRINTKTKILRAIKLIISIFVIDIVCVSIIYVVVKAENEYRRNTILELINVPATQDVEPLKCVFYLGRVGGNHIFSDRFLTTIVRPVASVKDRIYLDTIADKHPKFTEFGIELPSDYAEWQANIEKKCGDNFFVKKPAKTIG